MYEDVGQTKAPGIAAIHLVVKRKRQIGEPASAVKPFTTNEIFYVFVVFNLMK